MKVLIGTTNPAKVTRFADFLPDSGIEFLTLKDLGNRCKQICDRQDTIGVHTLW